jgi:phytoene synthase
MSIALSSYNQAYQYCQNKVAKSGSSFYYSFLFLPPEKYQAIIPIYAFCREVDDIVDDCQTPEIAEQKLAWWHTEIQALFTGNPTHPITQALLPHIKTHGLHQHLFEEILNGMLMDLRYQGYETFNDLKLYCHCVASAVGLLVAQVFGFTDNKTLEYAKQLGIALQLVNIIRDIGEDADRGRIYIPAEDLRRFHVDPNDIFDKKYSDAFKACMAFQATRAQEYYQHALLTLPSDDAPNQRAGLIMAAIYFSLLKEIQQSDFTVLEQRFSLTPIRKLWVAWKTWRQYRPTKK